MSKRRGRNGTIPGLSTWIGSIGGAASHPSQEIIPASVPSYRRATAVLRAEHFPTQRSGYAEGCKSLPLRSLPLRTARGRTAPGSWSVRARPAPGGILEAWTLEGIGPGAGAGPRVRSGPGASGREDAASIPTRSEPAPDPQGHDIVEALQQLLQAHGPDGVGPNLRTSIRWGGRAGSSRSRVGRACISPMRAFMRRARGSRWGQAWASWAAAGTGRPRSAALPKPVASGSARWRRSPPRARRSPAPGRPGAFAPPSCAGRGLCASCPSGSRRLGPG